MIECKICGFKGKRLTSHVTRKHGISTEDYKAHYGPLLSPSESQAQAARMAARNRSQKARDASRENIASVNDRYASDPTYKAKMDAAKRKGWTPEARANYGKLSSKLRKEEWAKGQHTLPKPKPKRPIHKVLWEESVALWKPSPTAPWPSESNRGRHSTCNPEVFDTLTHVSAYWVGFLMADGGVWNDGNGSRIQLSLQIADRPHVEDFAEFLNIGSARHDATYKGESFPAWRALVRSERLVFRLAEHGVVSDKSNKPLTVTSPCMAINPCFWRGYFDGDDNISIDRRNGSLMVEVGSTAYPLLQQICHFLARLRPKRRPYIPQRMTGKDRGGKQPFYRVRFGGPSARKFLETVYDAPGPRLSHKERTFRDWQASGWKSKRGFASRPQPPQRRSR